MREINEWVKEWVAEVQPLVLGTFLGRDNQESPLSPSDERSRMGGLTLGTIPDFRYGTRNSVLMSRKLLV